MGSVYAYAYEESSGYCIGHWITDCCDDVGFDKIAEALLTRYIDVNKIETLVQQGVMSASRLVFGGEDATRCELTLHKMLFDNVFDIEARIFTRGLDIFPDAFFLFQGGYWTFVTPRWSRYDDKDVWDIGNFVPFDLRYYKCSCWKKLNSYV